MRDLIDRQAAIDAISKYDFSFPEYMERFVTELRDAMKADLLNDMKSLPSVHAEPMRWHYDDFPPSDPEKRYVVVRTNELFVKPILDTADYYTGDGMYSEKPWHLDGGYSCYPSEILAWADVGEIGEIIKHISGKEQA